MINKNVHKTSDTEMYLLIKAQNKESFDYLYSKYSCILYGMALKSFDSKKNADEVVQKTFVKVWKSIDLFINQKASFNVWMIQNLIIVIQEHLTSNKVTHTLKTNHFPDFKFEISKPESDKEFFETPDSSIMNLNLI